MYIPNKPAKYGVKLVLANDVHSKYLLAGIPYLGIPEPPSDWLRDRTPPVISLGTLLWLHGLKQKVQDSSRDL